MGTAYAQQMCYSFEQVEKILKNFGESKAWFGLSDFPNENKGITFLYINSDTGTWSIVYHHFESEKACILNIGRVSEFMELKEKLKGTAS